MTEPWSLPQGRTGRLRLDELVEIVEAGGRETPCYGCGELKPSHLGAVFICDSCGRAVCNFCWDNHHLARGCRLPAGTAEGVAAEWAAEWAAEIKAGRVRPDGVIATGVVPDVGGDR